MKRIRSFPSGCGASIVPSEARTLALPVAGLDLREAPRPWPLAVAQSALPSADQAQRGGRPVVVLSGSRAERDERLLLVARSRRTTSKRSAS